MMRMIMVALGVGALALSVPASSFAAPVGACVADMKEKCSGVQPGEGRIKACVKEHLTEFSEPCQTRLAKIAAIGKACAADIKEKCGSMKRGGGRKVACIRGVLGDLSDTCKEALGQALAGRRDSKSSSTQ